MLLPLRVCEFKVSVVKSYPAELESTKVKSAVKGSVVESKGKLNDNTLSPNMLYDDNSYPEKLILLVKPEKCCK